MFKIVDRLVLEQLKQETWWVAQHFLDIYCCRHGDEKDETADKVFFAEKILHFDHEMSTGVLVIVLIPHRTPVQENFTHRS